MYTKQLAVEMCSYPSLSQIQMTPRQTCFESSVEGWRNLVSIIESPLSLTTVANPLA